MEQKSIGCIIINSPYEEPAEHWRYNRERRISTRGTRKNNSDQPGILTNTTGSEISPK